MWKQKCVCAFYCVTETEYIKITPVYKEANCIQILSALEKGSTKTVVFSSERNLVITCYLGYCNKYILVEESSTSSTTFWNCYRFFLQYIIPFMRRYLRNAILYFSSGSNQGLYVCMYTVCVYVYICTIYVYVLCIYMYYICIFNPIY